MHFARVLLHGHASWWFDMWGGWFASSGYMEFMEKAMALCREALALPMGSIAQVAVFADETAYCKANNPALSRKICAKLHTLGTVGVPYDLYLAEDLGLIDMNRYKAVVLLEPAMTEVSAFVASCGLPVLRINEQNLDVTTDQLRQFYERSGAHLYSREDMVVYANESYLFVHTTRNGLHKLQLPERCSLTDVFTGEPFIPEFQAAAGKSFLLQRTPQ